MKALIVPAMGVRARYYDPLVEALAERSIAATAMELRADGDYGFAALVEDTAAAIREQGSAQGSEQGSAPIVIGHSLGGHLAALAAADTPTGGLVLVAADSPYHRRYGRRGPFVLANAMLAAKIAAVFGSFPGDKIGGIGRQPRMLMTEWAYLTRTGRYGIDGLPTAEADVGVVDGPVLAISIDGDSTAPPATITHFTDKLSRARVQRWHYAGKGLDHIRWVRRPEPVAERIAEWLSDPTVRMQGC